MRLLFILFATLSVSFASVSAKEFSLKAGDVIELVDGERWTRRSIREKLKEYGLSNLGPGGHTGRILSVSGYAENRKRYDIRVNSHTGLVLRVARIRNFTY